MKKEKPDVQVNNKGMTLVEMIITFALMGIFLAAVAAVISSSIVLHSEMTGTMYAQSVGEILLEKATGELSGAKVKDKESIVIETVYEEGEPIGEGVRFYDKNGNKTRMYVEDGFFVMDGETSFSFDEGAYMGYRITDFGVNRLNQENVFEVVIQLKNLKTGFEYTASGVAMSYHFETEEDFLKIISNE